MLKVFRQQRSPLPRREFQALRDGLLGSSLVGVSTLNGPFEASRGFGVTFTEAGFSELAARFPMLGPWLERGLGAPAIRALTPWWRRTLTRLPNAWYLNLLVVGPGADVKRHVDGTLMRVAKVDDHPPECVSVLYLETPFQSGGELLIWNGALPVALITPRAGEAVHFRGDLAHEVRPFEGPPEARRASLVIEQYHFEPAALANVPAFHVESRAGFEGYLKAHARRPPKQFDLEP